MHPLGEVVRSMFWGAWSRRVDGGRGDRPVRIAAGGKNSTALGLWQIVGVSQPQGCAVKVQVFARLG